METTLNVVEGMQFDRGYVSPYFVTDSDRWRRCSRIRTSHHQREEADGDEGSRAAAGADRPRGKPLLIIAEDVEGEAGDPGGEQAARHPLGRAVKAPALATAARRCSRTSPS